MNPNTDNSKQQMKWLAKQAASLNLQLIPAEEVPVEDPEHVCRAMQ